LVRWLLANRTGNARLKAGLPVAWRVGGKTGSGGFGTTNDVAVIWAPGRAAVVANVCITQTRAPFGDRNAAMADIARVAGSRDGELILRDGDSALYEPRSSQGSLCLRCSAGLG
jgi:beta-lactamase class A